MTWAVWGVVAIGVWETYARFPAVELYNVTGTGFGGGAARTLVFLDWPVAIAAVALVVVAADRLLAGAISRRVRVATQRRVGGGDRALRDDRPARRARPEPPRRPGGQPAGRPSASCSRWLVTLAAVRVRGTGVARAAHARRPAGDRRRPAARDRRGPVDPGRRRRLHRRRPSPRRRLHLEDCRALSRASPGSVPSTWETTRASTASSSRRPRSPFAARLRRMRPTVVRPLLGGYLALIAVYGMAVAADDFWIEQLQKRATVSRRAPVRPHARAATGVGGARRGRVPGLRRRVPGRERARVVDRAPVERLVDVAAGHDQHHRAVDGLDLRQRGERRRARTPRPGSRPRRAPRSQGPARRSSTRSIRWAARASTSTA